MSEYDNTDERGEDAVARQRGGSERPQHVDTCRVYNCYGCEEIVDEPEPLICGVCGTEMTKYDIGCLHLADNDDEGHIGIAATPGGDDE